VQNDHASGNTITQNKLKQLRSPGVIASDDLWSGNSCYPPFLALNSL